MNVIDECSLWLQINIDGENSAVFSGLTKDVANSVNQQCPTTQRMWLVDFWFAQLQAAGVNVSNRMVLDHSRATINNHGTDAFLELIKVHIEQYNLPRANHGTLH